VSNKKKNRTRGYSIFSIFLFPRSFTEKYLKAVTRFVKRSQPAIRYWIQKYNPELLSFRKIRLTEFIIDETITKVGSNKHTKG
jgi:hypothetical protein